MAGVRRLAESVYLLPGSPNTVIVERGDRVCVVDPGIGAERPGAVREAVEGVAGGEARLEVLLTHGHTDHLAAAEGLKYEVLAASRLCMGLVESLKLRFSAVYGGIVSREFASMPPVELKVTRLLEPGSSACEGVEVAGTPGHTPGHVAYIVEGEVVAAGDAVLGERVLARFGVPFALDLRAWVESLTVLEELARAGYTIVPGHGPVASGGRAVGMVRANREAALRVYNAVLEELSRKPMTVEELAVRLTLQLGSAGATPRQVALNRTTVQSVLAWLEEEGRVEPVVEERGLVWRLRG